MILRSSSIVILLLCLAFQSTHVSGDADFESVRLRYDYIDMSGRYGDPKGKYWREFVDALSVVYVTDICVHRRVCVSQGCSFGG